MKYKYKRILVQVIKNSGLRVSRSSNAPREHGIARRGAAVVRAAGSGSDPAALMESLAEDSSVRSPDRHTNLRPKGGPCYREPETRLLLLLLVLLYTLYKPIEIESSYSLPET